jgi:hypothetical protein
MSLDSLPVRGMPPMTAVRHLGDGYEPHVTEDAGVLTYSLPVDSGFVSGSFTFRLQPEDLEVLFDNSYRRAVLEVVVHAILQRSMLAGGIKVTQEAFAEIVTSVLHSTPADLEHYIDRIDQGHHMVVRHFVTEILARRNPRA